MRDIDVGRVGNLERGWIWYFGNHSRFSFITRSLGRTSLDVSFLECVR